MKEIIVAAGPGLLSYHDRRRRDNLLGAVERSTVLQGKVIVLILLTYYKVFAGQDIDLDASDATAGPESSQRSIIIANDPYAAAKFFHFIVRTILEELLGVRVDERRHITRQDGIFGTVEAYVGTVEAQGRGTLYLHMIVWLRGGPTACEMKEKLFSSDFQATVAESISSNIRAHHDGVTAESLSTIPRERCISYSRPLDPRQEGFKAQRNEKEQQLVRAVQIHKCGRGCLKMKKGRMLCKSRVPFPLSPVAWVNSAGDWGPKRTYPFMNN
ncbi:hypothetical protein EV702DRAFT_981831 [Suillus placidus]|uniref:Helitron helicase-like domain-containing protein n=1 Tax=Suillus placidus TaxID=48579 RepID=A0A9P7CV84_9AGAM|nr:hypothetical protein EV702DRAFT_981831 [Suillus placidus]